MKAFPCEWIEIKPNTIDSSHVSNYQEITHTESGMDLRDYFAAKAMPTVFDNSNFIFEDKDYKETAEISYKIADAMMKARGK